jgi:hypothetical protein
VDRCIALVAALLTVLAITQFAGRAVTINSELDGGVMRHGGQFEKQAVW